MQLVLDVQVFQGGHKGLSLEAPGRPRGDGRVADGALSADGDDVAPERRSQVSRLVPGLGHAAHVEAPAEIDAVEDLRQPKEKKTLFQTAKLLVSLLKMT